MKKLFLFFIAFNSLFICPMNNDEDLKEAEKGIIENLLYNVAKHSSYDDWLKKEETLKLNKRVTRSVQDCTPTDETPTPSQDLLLNSQFCLDKGKNNKRCPTLNTRLEKAIEEKDSKMVALIALNHYWSLTTLNFKLAQIYLEEEEVAIKKQQTQQKTPAQQLRALANKIGIPNPSQSGSTTPSPSTSPPNPTPTPAPSPVLARQDVKDIALNGSGTFGDQEDTTTTTGTFPDETMVVEKKD